MKTTTEIAADTDSTIHLIGIGKVEAVVAENLKPGQRVIWNYGYVSYVVNVSPIGRTMVRVAYCNDQGEMTHRRHRRSFKVGIWK